ncbi:MAG: cytochrome C [Sulfurimonas sp.]|uniref:c-type cytochrome n=1 Tax=Sulfurimonas sp. TaxID=2022749 RepID=UPI0025E434E0|nr:cytochrome C [Sulfurimonas sp.]MCK9491983.1 cytochrome C [Sulfurimonas sp.]
MLLLFFLSLDASEYGSLLFHGNCITCHHETKAISAPSIVEIREKYLSAFADKEDFVEYMSTWVKEPKEETSIMLDAIEKYGLMPELAYELDALREISAYIYETDFSKEHSGH